MLRQVPLNIGSSHALTGDKWNVWLHSVNRLLVVNLTHTRTRYVMLEASYLGPCASIEVRLVSSLFGKKEELRAAIKLEDRRVIELEEGTYWGFV